MQFRRKLNGFDCLAYTNPENDAMFVELKYASSYHVKPYNEVSFEHAEDLLIGMSKKHRAVIAYIKLLNILPPTIQSIYEDHLEALRLALNIFCDCPSCGQPLVSITLYPCTNPACRKEFKR